MSPGEIYFWTTLPRLSNHCYTACALTFFGGFIWGMFGAMAMDVGRLEAKVYYRAIVGVIILGSLFGWAGTLLPDESQVKQIISGAVGK